MPAPDEAIARRMITRIAPEPDREEAPSSPTDDTTDESATGEGALFGGDLILKFAGEVTRVAAQAWTLCAALPANVLARRKKAAQTGDMPTLQRETAHLKQVLLHRLRTEVVTKPDLPESFRARLLDAAAEETLAEIDRR